MTTPRLDELVSRTGWSVLWTDVIGLMLRAVGIVAIAVGAAVLIDAGYALPGAGLVVLDVALLAALLYAIWPALARCWRGRPNARATAVYLEERLGLHDNRLINALDLSRQDTAGVSEALRDEAIARGEAAALKADCEPVIDHTPIKRALTPACVAVVGLIVAYALLPSMFHAVAPRLLLPYDDLPPFTWVKFDVATDPQPVYHGKPATIRAELSGVSGLDQAQVVFVEDGVKSAPLPMARQYTSFWAESGGKPGQTAAEAASAAQESLRVEKASEEGTARFSFRVDRVEGVRQFYIKTPRGRSGLYTLEADTSPLIERASASYTYPEYTHWKDSAGPLSSAGVRALAGTNITVRVESNVPLKGGTLRLEPEGDSASPPTEQSLTPDPEDPRSARVTFPLESTGQFNLSLIGADGRPGVDDLNGPITALPDRAPKIEFVLPDRQVVAPEGWAIDAQVSAGDDIGIGPITLHGGLNEQPTTPTPLPSSYIDARKTVARADHAFDLSSLGAKAGDTVRYYAEVMDNHPGLPQRAETPVYAIHVITMQQYLELARTQYRIDDINVEFEAVLERLDELESKRNALLEELEALRAQQEAGEALTDEQMERFAELEQALDDYARESSALAGELQRRAEQGTLYEFEEAYKQMLSELGEQLAAQGEQAEALAEAMRQMREGMGNTSAEAQASAESAFRDAADRFAMFDEPFSQEVREQAEMTAEDLKKLKHAEAMMSQGERIRRIALEQDELAVHLSSMVKPGASSDEDKQRAGELAQEQARLRDELDEARHALRDAAEAAKDELPRMSEGALSVADRIDSLGIVPTQSAAEKATLAGNGPIAYQAAREAADKLDSLLSDVSQQQAQASNDLDGCFLMPRQQLQSALEQMASARSLPGMGGQGGSGMGMSGAMARMSMVGPALPGQPGGDSLSRDGRIGRDGRGGLGRSVTSADDLGDEAELIHAGASGETGAGVGMMPGVPTDYREQAEAYFKRIAEEERGDL